MSNIFSLIKGIRTEKVFVFHHNWSRDEDFTFAAAAPLEVEIVTQVYSSLGQTSKSWQDNKKTRQGIFSLSVRCPNGNVLDAYALWIPGRGFIYSPYKSESGRCKGVLEGVSHDIAIMGTPPRVIYRDKKNRVTYIL